MDVRQSLQDLVLLLKHERKAQVICAVVILLLIWAMFGETKPRQRVVLQPLPPTNVAPPAREGYQDLVTSLQKQLEDQKAKLTEAEEANKQLKENLAQNEEKITEILKKVIERMSDLEQQQAKREESSQAPVVEGGHPIPALEDDGLKSWGDLDQPLVEAPVRPVPRKVAIIGAGDSVRIRLLAGVNAPTDGTPYPVVFELIDDVIGPDNSSLPLGGARLIAAAQGSLSDQRALFRLTTMNIRFPDGSRKILDVDGWVVGEDGIRGMEGVLIDPIGKALAGSMLSGTVEGLGDGIAAANSRTITYGYGNTTTFVDGDIAQYAAGRGVQKTGERWSRFIDERMALLVPHVKILSGREATAVFSKSVTIDGLYEKLEDDETVLASLD